MNVPGTPPLAGGLTPDELAEYERLTALYDGPGLPAEDFPLYTSLASRASGIESAHSPDPGSEGAALLAGGEVGPSIVGETTTPPPATGTPPAAGGAGTGPALGALSGAPTPPPRTAMPTAPEVPSMFEVPASSGLVNMGETAMAEGLKSAPMPGPSAFAGAAAAAPGMGQKMMGALTSKAGMGLLMTGIGAALYMTSRKKTKEEPRKIASTGQTPASPNISTLNPYAATVAGSPSYGSVLPGNFRIQ